MQRQLVTLLFMMTSLAGCRTADRARPEGGGVSAPEMTAVDISLTADNPEISTRPFQFWMHRGPQDSSPVLATNRSARTLRYVAANHRIDIPVSPSAVRCMGTIFAAIEQANIKQSAAWQEFKKLWPYRFLEIMPEVHDYYTYHQETPASRPDADRSSLLRNPALWSGLPEADSPLPGTSGFRVRGYLKWQGVLLADGVTCLISRPDDIARLLSDAIRCELDYDSYCVIANEGDQ